MKIRRIYKRDKDGQFARVNTLLGAAADAATKKRLKSKAHSPNRLPSKSDVRRRRDTIRPEVLDAAAGKLSLAAGPAREIAAKHDLSGHNRSEANKAAYRECAKFARELKAKYGADAPTADRIYSAAKLIQKGGDLDAKIRQEEGDGAVPKPKPDTPNPQPPKASGKPTGSSMGLTWMTDGELKKRLETLKERVKAGVANDGDRESIKRIEQEIKDRRVTRKVNAGTKIDGKELKRGDIFQLPGGKGEYVVVKNDGTTVVAEKRGQQKVTHVRFDASRKFEKIGEGKEPRGTYGTGPGAPRANKPKPKEQYGSEITNPGDAQIRRENTLKDAYYTWWMGAEEDYPGETNKLVGLDSFFDGISGTYHGDKLGYKNNWDERIAADRKLLQDLGSEDKMAARMRAGFERWIRTSNSPVDALKDNGSYNNDELFDMYLENDPQQMFFSPLFNMYDLADRVRKEIRADGFDAKKAVLERKPRQRIDTIIDRLARAEMYRGSSGSDDERRQYQAKLAKQNKELNDHIADSDRDQLKEDLDRAKRDWRTYDRDLKVLKIREAQGNSVGSLLSNKQQQVNAAVMVINKLQARIDEIDGKIVDVAPYLGPQEAVRPVKARRSRERNLIQSLRSWVVDQEPGTANKLKTGDAEQRAIIIERFINTMRNQATVDRQFAYNNHAIKNGYGDLTREEVDALLKQDQQALEDALNPSIIKERVEADFDEWLMTSTAAADLQAGMGDNTVQDFWDAFSTGAYFDENFGGFGSSVMDYVSVFDAVDKDLNKKYRGGLANEIASRPRPDAGTPAQKPLYKAKDRSRASELRKELKSAEEAFADGTAELFSDPNFKDLPEEEKQRRRDEVGVFLKQVSSIADELAKLKPNRSRELVEATSYEDLVDIMLDRNPNIHAMNGWHEPDGDLAKELEAKGIYGVHREMMLKRSVRAMEAAERMADEYPDVPWDEFNAYGKSAFGGQSQAIAHCSRGYTIKIEFNTNFLTGENLSPNNNSDGFHPPNFEKDPHYNCVIHEFGHSIDWIAFGYHDAAKGDVVKEARDKGDNRDAQVIWDEWSAKAYKQRDEDIMTRVVAAYDDEVRAKRHKPMTGITAQRDFEMWLNANRSGYSKKNGHELIAESWQDYHTNGESASPVSKAVVEFVLQNYRAYLKKKGKTSGTK